MRFIENSQRVMESAVGWKPFGADRNAPVTNLDRKAAAERQTLILIHRLEPHQLGEQVIGSADQLQIEVSAFDQVTIEAVGIMKSIFLGQEMNVRSPAIDPLEHNGLQVAHDAIIGWRIQIEIFNFISD